MQQPVKIGPAILGLFSLPFLFFGVLTLASILNLNRISFHGSVLAGTMVACVFLFIGSLILVGAFKGYAGMKRKAALEEANPISPWMWRDDWASRRAESSNKNSELLYWILCIFCNGISIPVMATVFPTLARALQPQAFVAIAFGLAGAGLLAQAIRVSIRRRRFGKTSFEFNALPFSPGDRVSGRIQLKMDEGAERGIDLRLVCLRRTVTNFGKDSTTSETILWEGDQNVPIGALAPRPLGRAVPVDFAVPADAYVTDQNDSRDQVIWRLYAHADMPGVDYKDSFEIPVFKTSTAPIRDECFDAPKFSSSQDAACFSSDSSQPESGDVPKPTQIKVQISPAGAGTQFYFKAFRNPVAALVLVAFTAAWNGIVYFLWNSKAPVLFPVVFSLFDVLLVFAALHAVLGSSRVVVGNGEITVRSGILGMGRTRRVRASDVISILPLASVQQGNTLGNTVYAIQLKTKDGRRIRLADAIDSRSEARWIVGQIETLAGLKIDTHVETNTTFGPPPQPGLSSNPQDWPLRGRMLAGRRDNSYVPIIVCFAFILAMMGFMVSRQNAFRARTNGANRNRASNAATRANSAARRKFAAPMADTDDSRISGLPAQDQAEELLERAIEHDERALELFEKKIDGWTGQLKETERLKQLEKRSEFSRDLRVRYANADLNLALQGWQKSEDLAERTIQQAQTDKEHRAWALYYLGMMAGRGVDYEHIHSVLLEYAKHDPDANVRQWAVEGMRYLGKDDVLDDLFESFTHDPATQVRNRAGCNISDCGNFARIQRMRMTPQLIDLAANPSSNAQMRGWCFMALREITGAQVLDNAEAWRSWYDAHGAEKTAEFEKMDWWKVRGDE
jgi:hypothetical protein